MIKRLLLAVALLALLPFAAAQSYAADTPARRSRHGCRARRSQRRSPIRPTASATPNAAYPTDGSGTDQGEDGAPLDGGDGKGPAPGTATAPAPATARAPQGAPAGEGQPSQPPE
ncbi:MAG: hypothetical protein WDN31_08480 [Hyphomicrobium sp.]